MISSLTWIPRGAARAKPVRFELSPEEVTRIQNLASEEAEIEKLNQEEDAEDDMPAEPAEDGEPIASDDDDEEDVVAAVDEDDTPLPAELRMDEYDDEDDMPNPLEDLDDAEDEMDMEILGSDGAALAYEPRTHEDDAEDEEDDAILPSDSLLVMAITEDEQSHLEVQVFSQDGALYVHHDILLPDFPLCLAWMDIPPCVGRENTQRSVGNYLAVGTFSPAIEIWNLDVLDAIEPSATLGGEDATAMAARRRAAAAKKSKKKSSVRGAGAVDEPVYLAGSHSDAVMALSWNSVYRQLLASGSADRTVKVWDVTTQQCSHTFSHHSDKVQAVAWHGSEGWLLASGAFDKRVCLVDGRSCAVATAATLSADVESLAWDPFSPYHLYVSQEDGRVACIDIRRAGRQGEGEGDGVVFSFDAHHKTTSALHFSPLVKGMLATASLDKTVKVWDVRDAHTAAAHGAAPSAPKCVAYKTMNVGKLMSVRYSPDDPFLLATGGDKGVVAVWESDELDVIRAHFEDAVVHTPSAYGALTQESAATPATATTTATESFAEAVQIVSPPPQDDSWMDDNAGIATNAQPGDKDKKKKKKKAPK